MSIETKPPSKTQLVERVASHPSKHYARPHDSWQCQLDHTSSCGGSGTHGYRGEDCLPVPSLRLQRGIFTTACTAIVVGLLMACLVGPNRNDFFAPGPLTDSHAQILAAEGGQRCASCHGAGDKSLASWITDAVSSGKHIPVSQSQLCMDCHNNTLVSEFAMTAHNVSPARLQSITTATRPSQHTAMPKDPRNRLGELACATCHKEHHGANFNLTALTDKQCQTCHVNYIHSFEKGHPEFTSWPFQERTGIAFDHVSHGIKHFKEKGIAFNCQQCHIDDAGGEVKLVANFSDTCASCHADDISGQSAPDWTLLKLPMLDLDAISNVGDSVGSWPAECSGDFDGQLPAAMKLLLMADETAAQILIHRGEEFEFADLNPDNPQDVKDAVALSWAIKALLSDLASGGEAEVQARVGQTIEVSAESSWRDLSFGLHKAVFQQANSKWFPDLEAEIASRKNGTSFGQRSSQFDSISANESLFARPTQSSLQQERLDDGELLAKNPLDGLVSNQELNSPVSSNAQSNGTTSITNYPAPKTRPDGNGSRIVENAHTAKRAGLPRGQFEANDEWLAKNPLAGLAQGSKPVVPPVAIPIEPSLTQQEKYEKVRQAIIRMPDATNRGWQRDDHGFAISYRISGHADPLMRAWVDLANQHMDQNAIHDSGIYQSVNSTLAAGQCRQCHTVDKLDNGQSIVNWMPKYRDVSVRGFTRFSHRPHDTQSGLDDCTSCHRLDETQSNKETFAGHDPAVGRSNFMPISRADCANCHREGGAPSGCVDCHNYHVGSKIFHK